MNITDKKTSRNKALLLIAALVLLVIGYRFFAWQMLETQGEQAGTRLMPPIPLSDMVLMDQAGEALPARLLKEKWSYVIFAETGCDDACEQQLLVTKQAAASVGQRIVQRLLVVAFEPSDDFMQALRADHPELVVAVLTRPIWTIFTVQFMAAIQEIGGSPFFLVNPNGLVVTGYDDLVSAEDVVSDLGLLLKVE